MESKHKELLVKCYKNLFESITDADRVVKVLVQTGTLSQLERHELGFNCSSNAEKVDRLLKMLMRKDNDHFLDLCAALEKTHPHLDSALLFTEGAVDHSSGSTYSVLSTMPSDSESSSSLSSIGEFGLFLSSIDTTDQASSPPPAHMESRRGQMSEKMETVLFQLRQVTRERDELRKHLVLSSPGTTFDDCSRPNSKSDQDYERLKLQCTKAMTDVQSLQNQHSSSLKRCEEAVKKADFYYARHHRLVSEQAQLKEELEAVRQDNIQLVREHNQLKQGCEEMRRLHEDDQRELVDMRLLHQQVMRASSSEVLSKLYDMTVDKLECAKRDYEVLKKRYSEKAAHHKTDLSRLEKAEETNQRLQKQMDMLLKQRDTAIHYQQQYPNSMRKLDSNQAELSKAALQNTELQREIERLQVENTRLKTQQLQAVKDCEKHRDERDAVFKEYRLIMSERDQVIMEVDHLQTGLETAEAKLQNISSERRMAGEELEAIRQELGSALIDRDKAICEKTELLEKYRHEVKHKGEAQTELRRVCKDMETVQEERDVTRKEKTEAVVQRDQLLREYYQARQKHDSASLDMERVAKEVEVLRKQNEAMVQELKEATQEAEVAKCRRDWAFQERDKIVSERESIRTLCDNLRQERDRAVSDLADVLRKLDDTRKQKNDVSRDLKELKEKLEDQLEKEARFQLMTHSSHDSAIDTDSVEWEMEVVQLDKDREDMDLKALGFDVAEGVNDPYLPGDCGIFVSKVDKGSIAEGRLRVNDWLLKINNVDLTNKDRKEVLKAVLSEEGVVNFVVRRKKCLGGRLMTSVQINLSGHTDSGIELESGVFVSGVAPASPAAIEGSLAVGDRLLAINGVSVDAKSLSECEALLQSCKEVLSVSLYKFLPQSYSAQSIFENLRDASENSSNSRSLHTCPDIHFQNCWNAKHKNSSTQTEVFCPDTGSSDGEAQRNQVGSDAVGNNHSGDGSLCSHVKLFSSSSVHSRSLTTRGSLMQHSLLTPARPKLQQVYLMRQELHSRQSFTFRPVAPDGVPLQSTLLDGDETQGVGQACSPDREQLNGGTWPKVMVSTSFPESAHLSIYKPSHRRSILDLDTFKRPDATSNLDQLSPPQPPKHSQQSSESKAGPGLGAGLEQTPPTPPQRSDSFRFTLRCNRDVDCMKQHCYVEPTGDGKQPIGSSGKSCNEEVGRERGKDGKRCRPKSAPSLRQNMPPLHLQIPMQIQSLSNDEASPETLDLVRVSAATRSHRDSSNWTANSVHRGPAPCPAVTAVMRNPVYTAWSHDVDNCNCPPAPSHPQPHPSLQHQGRLNLDLSNKHSGDIPSDSSSSTQEPHCTNSLPSKPRLGNALFRAECVILPRTGYPPSAGCSDRGSLSQSEGSSLSHSTPPRSLINIETNSFASSQSQSSISTSTTQPRKSVSPAPIGGQQNDRPYLEEPRTVTVQKGAEPLGISIVSGENGGVFVSKVMAGSIAHQVGLEYGDQLLEFNGINLRNANEQQARLVIGQQCDIITILAQYNPHMFQLGIHSRSSSWVESINGQPSRTSDYQANIHEEGTMSLPSKHTSPATSPCSSFRLTSSGGCCHNSPGVRFVWLKKTQVELGLKICGGNLSGIYIERLEEDSPVKCPDGLLIGDQILEYNGVSMKNMTAEEAYIEMLKPADTVAFKVQHSSDKLAMLRGSPGDGFYIRALYDRVADTKQELSFKKDDILYIEDTLPGGNFGIWMGWQLDERARKLARGQIPSKYMMDLEFYRRHCTPDGKDNNAGGSKNLSAAARRSFFRRKQKHKCSGSKDRKDPVALDAVSADSLPVVQDGVILAYQSVQKVECSGPRPVLVLGPLAELNKDMLVKEAPKKFCRCIPEVMKASQQAIERGVRDCVFIDYKRRSGHFDVTTVACIKEITEKDSHCLLEIAPHAIERLHSVHIYPIVIFIRYKNAKLIKDQKDQLYLKDKVTQKHSKELFEMAQKTEQDYSKFFTGVVQGVSLADICSQIMTIVEQEQSKVLWIPEASL
ncbi:hypothetical protein UPYG_G00329540 [Umbra pygmaea]|uniref:Uncharacterized protein n=1 Tax=Umbra pygmaea TaxID=75934 RepID=A0ABD0WKP1_UMBPY